MKYSLGSALHSRGTRKKWKNRMLSDDLFCGGSFPSTVKIVNFLKQKAREKVV